MVVTYEAELSGNTNVTLVSKEDLPRYLITVDNGKIIDANGENFDTSSTQATNANRDAGYAIFVMDHYGNIYANKDHKEGEFHHSSFLHGATVACAGGIQVHDGVVKSINNKSGHYVLNQSHLGQTVARLQLEGINIGPDQIAFY
jgi:hypothetical protein